MRFARFLQHNTHYVASLLAGQNLRLWRSKICLAHCKRPAFAKFC